MQKILNTSEKKNSGLVTPAAMSVHFNLPVNLGESIDSRNNAGRSRSSMSSNQILISR